MAQKPTKSIVAFELYNTLSKQFTEAEVTLEKLKPYPTKRFEGGESLNLINARRQKDGMSMWKGHIFGVVYYKDGSSAIIRISRYAAFFRELKEDKLYVLEGPNRDKWFAMVDSFITADDVATVCGN
jgi:hypothetical protein